MHVQKYLLYFSAQQIKATALSLSIKYGAVLQRHIHKMRYAISIPHHFENNNNK